MGFITFSEWKAGGFLSIFLYKMNWELSGNDIINSLICIFISMFCENLQHFKISLSNFNQNFTTLFVFFLSIYWNWNLDRILAFDESSTVKQASRNFSMNDQMDNSYLMTLTLKGDLHHLTLSLQHRHSVSAHVLCKSLWLARFTITFVLFLRPPCVVSIQTIKDTSTELEKVWKWHKMHPQNSQSTHW